MRIAVVSDVVYPWTVGGSEIRLHEIYSRLAKKHDVWFFTMRYPSMPEGDFLHQGMRMHPCSEAPKTLYHNGRRKKIPAIRFSIDLWREMVGMDFDAVVVNQTPFFPFFSTWLHSLTGPGSKIIGIWHEYWNLDYWKSYLGDISGIVGFGLQQAALTLPDYVVCVSQSTLQSITQVGLRHAHTMTVVPNGVDSRLLKRIRRETSPIPKRAIFVGRLIPEKRVDRFIEVVRAASEVDSEVTGVIIGDGPQMNVLKKLAGDAPIKFHGFFEDHESVLREVAKSSVFISFSQREGFNMSALEACQLGLSTFVDRSYFDHENLFTLDSLNTDDIVKIIRNSRHNNNEMDSRYFWDTISENMERKIGDLVQ